MSKHTPGPWDIDWYECKMDKDDVTHAKKTGNNSAKVGDILWRAPRCIGPCGSEHSHWGGDLLTVDEADARLIAAAPDLLEALQNLLKVHEGEGGTKFHAGGIARAAIRKATGEQP